MENTINNFPTSLPTTTTTNPTSNYPNQNPFSNNQQNKYNSQNQFTYLNPINNSFQFLSILNLFTNYSNFQQTLNSKQIQIHFTLTNLQNNTFIQIPNHPTTTFPHHIITNSSQLPNIYQQLQIISNQLQPNNKTYSFSYFIIQLSTQTFIPNFHQISNQTQHIQSIPNNIPPNYQYPSTHPQNPLNSIFNTTSLPNPTPQTQTKTKSTKTPKPLNPQI